MSLFASIAAIVSLLLTSDRKSSRWRQKYHFGSNCNLHYYWYYRYRFPEIIVNIVRCALSLVYIGSPTGNPPQTICLNLLGKLKSQVYRLQTVFLEVMWWVRERRMAVLCGLYTFLVCWLVLLDDKAKSSEVDFNETQECQLICLECTYFTENAYFSLWNAPNSWFPLKSVSILGIGDWRLSRKTYGMHTLHTFQWNAKSKDLTRCGNSLVSPNCWPGANTSKIASRSSETDQGSVVTLNVKEFDATIWTVYLF